MAYKVMTITKEHRMEFPISIHKSKEAAMHRKKHLVASSKKRGHWNTGDKYWITKTKPRTRPRPRARRRQQLRRSGLSLSGGLMRGLR